MCQMALMSGVDSASVFCTFRYYKHMLHKVKHWLNPLNSLALYQMDTRDS